MKCFLILFTIGFLFFIPLQALSYPRQSNAHEHSKSLRSKKFNGLHLYKKNGERLKAIELLDSIPPDNEVNYNKASLYNSLRMNYSAKESLKGVVHKDLTQLKYKIKKDDAISIKTNYMLFTQELADAYDLNMNRWGSNVSFPVKNNIRGQLEYNQYVYTSGNFPTGKFSNFTNEFKLGAYGRPSPKNEFYTNIGGKFYQNQGAMAVADTWFKRYMNDNLSLKLGFRRDNLEQSYISAVGTEIDGVFTGQVSDNKAYLDYVAKFPHSFYSRGRFAQGVMFAQNLPNNPYMEGKLVIGKILYDKPDKDGGIDFALLEAMSYNSTYRHDLLNLVSPVTGDTYGGYFSPGFYSANSLHLELEGGFKRFKRFRYELNGYIGDQESRKPTFNDPVWGLGIKAFYDFNDYVSLTLGFLYYNYADVQRNWGTLNLLIRCF